MTEDEVEVIAVRIISNANMMSQPTPPTSTSFEPELPQLNESLTGMHITSAQPLPSCSTRSRVNPEISDDLDTAPSVDAFPQGDLPSIQRDEPPTVLPEDENRPGCFLGSVPPEVQAHIFTFLPARDIEAMGAVCSALHVLSREPQVWKPLW